MVALTSAGGFLALLKEPDTSLQQYALEKLNDVVNEFWAEIADSVEYIETLAESDDFEAHELASLVASKVYYHLGAFEEAMDLAFRAGRYFDIFEKTEFVETLVAKCIDEYIKKRVDDSAIDPRLEDIVESMFSRCFAEGGYKQALGVALEARRFDKIKEAIKASGAEHALLTYCFEVSMTLVTLRDFRHQVFRILVELYHELENPDFVAICRILVFLNDFKGVAQILDRLMSSNEDDALLAYQIAFDLVSNGTQEFLLNVRKELPALPVEEKNDDIPDDDAVSGPTAMAVDTALLSSASHQQQGNDEFVARNRKVQGILSGETSITLYLEFLHKNNKADLGILKTTKTALEARNSVTHGATIFANAIMNAGTTRDAFLRENLEWLSRATNWAKFSATAGLGVIHKGHLKEGLRLLSPYLPQEGAQSSPYSEGGALYALGIIHANHGENITKYLVDALNNARNSEIIQHGACLGLGMAAMASGNEQLFENLQSVLLFDSAVAGEAAGIGMGLVMLGTASKESWNKMLAYAHETQHEKIIRGLALGMSLIMYGREEEADTLIDQLTLDKDSILRYGGMFTIAMAYCGTANNSAIRRLLHFAVSDVSDDVRRAAVIGLGFVLSRDPDQVPRMVSLLSESYNPHVRYGACMAVGIACAGTAMKEAINLLIPMASDAVDFVRQGALIALAMVLIQTTQAQEPKVEQVRKMFEDRIADKHEPTMAKFGAILGQGIIDAGGRNVTIALHSLSGHKNMPGIVGLALFTGYWYWYPLVHFISLAFTPTVIIGLNKDLKAPKFSFKSNAAPSLFAYPKEVKPVEVKGPTKLVTAVLSTTRKAKRFQEKRAKEKEGSLADSMDVEKPEEKKEEEKEEEQKEKKVEEPEPAFEIKSNPARVTPAQMKYISTDVDDRYIPIRRSKGDLFGIVLLKDTKPGEPERFVDDEEKDEDNKGQAHPSADEEEPAPPPAFTFTD